MYIAITHDLIKDNPYWGVKMERGRTATRRFLTEDDVSVLRHCSELHIYPLHALRMALETIDDDTASRLIHHSDRGCQYCSAAYVAELKKHNIMISMTQSGDPLENAIAERANGILKTEWLYKMKIPTIEKCKEEMKRIILFYNTERPHMSIGNKTPEVVHGETGGQKRCWRNPWDKPVETMTS